MKAFDSLNEEILQQLIPSFDSKKNKIMEFDDYERVKNACNYLFEQKRKQLQAIALLLSWMFGSVYEC